MIPPVAQADLDDLDLALKEKRLVPLRIPRHKEERVTRRGLTKFSDHIWLFPFGYAPKLSEPVQVYLNGILDDGLIFTVRQEAFGVIFSDPTLEGDVVQATYQVAPNGWW